MNNLNAFEAWSLYDTVCIGEGMGSVNSARWYETFNAFGQEDVISFFNQRNRAKVGVPYCNLDSAEQLPFAFHAYSIGVDFGIPSFDDMDPAWTDEVRLPALKSGTYNEFAAELPKHCSIRLQVSQDEKLLANCEAVPAGSGTSGFFNNSDTSFPTSELGLYHQYSNGAPHISNRWIFDQGAVQIPRNMNINVQLQFSTYGRELLKNMAGPGRGLINAAFGSPGQTYQGVTVPNLCTIRVSMFGKREVQQRNDLRFR